MFGKLKDKLKGWLGNEEEEEPKKATKKKDTKGKKSKSQEIKKKTEKKPVKKEVKSKKIKPEIVEVKEETPEKIQAEKAPETEEIEESEKKGFLKRIFKKKPEAELKESEKAEEPQEVVIEESETVEQPQETDEEIEEKPKESFLSRFTKKISAEKLTQEHVDEIIEPLELILLENNVALDVVDKIKEDLSKALVGTEVKKSEIENTIIQSLKDSISSVLIEPPDLLKAIKEKHGIYTIIFFGINGSGKTTSVAKLAHKLKKEGISCVLAAGDTFRAASIEQLETHADRIGVPIIKSTYGSDPTSVAFDAKKYAEKNNIKVVLIDTAGRMYTKENLIKQMEKIIRVIQPDLKIFVGESITGNDATEQAKTFHEAVGIQGIILSKADVDEKGGTALSVSYITKQPIYFLGVGQTYDDLQAFKKDTILKNLGLD